MIPFKRLECTFKSMSITSQRLYIYERGANAASGSWYHDPVPPKFLSIRLCSGQSHQTTANMYSLTLSVGSSGGHDPTRKDTVRPWSFIYVLRGSLDEHKYLWTQERWFSLNFFARLTRLDCGTEAKQVHLAWLDTKPYAWLLSKKSPLNGIHLVKPSRQRQISHWDRQSLGFYPCRFQRSSNFSVSVIFMTEIGKKTLATFLTESSGSVIPWLF